MILFESSDNVENIPFSQKCHLHEHRIMETRLILRYIRLGTNYVQYGDEAISHPRV